MKWINDWPVMGVDTDNDGRGEPVATYKKPNVKKTYPITTPADSDEFNDNTIGLQWQWMANPKGTWAFPNAAIGALTLFSDKLPDSAKIFGMRQMFCCKNFLLMNLWLRQK
jgi:beta-xylosidase